MKKVLLIFGIFNYMYCFVTQDYFNNALADLNKEIATSIYFIYIAENAAKPNVKNNALLSFKHAFNNEEPKAPAGANPEVVAKAVAEALRISENFKTALDGATPQRKLELAEELFTDDKYAGKQFIEALKTAGGAQQGKKIKEAFASAFPG
ncbi:MAG: hypothetical protein WA432_04345 [Candidatus Babeliaceae bacterium]